MKKKKNSTPKNMLWVSKDTMTNKQRLDIKRIPKNSTNEETIKIL